MLAIGSSHLISRYRCRRIFSRLVPKVVVKLIDPVRKASPFLQHWLAVRGQVVDARAERAQTAESMTSILTMQWTQAFALPVLFEEAHDVA